MGWVTVPTPATSATASMLGMMAIVVSPPPTAVQTWTVPPLGMVVVMGMDLGMDSEALVVVSGLERTAMGLVVVMGMAMRVPVVLGMHDMAMATTSEKEIL